MTAAQQDSVLTGQAVELAHVNTDLTEDPVVGVYRRSSIETPEPPPPYVVRPPPYTAQKPEAKKPRPRWEQWISVHRKKLMLAVVVLVPAIVCSTIFGTMKARAQGIVNALQFEGGNRTFLELSMSSTSFDFQWRDYLWNNDSQYASIELDDFKRLTVTLDGAENPFAEVYNDAGVLFFERDRWYAIYTYANSLYDDQMAELVRRVFKKQQVNACIEGRTKLKFSEYLPKYSVHFKKKIRLPGFGGITGYNVTDPQIWNLSDPAQMERDWKHPRYFNFRVDGNLVTQSSGPSIDGSRWDMMLAVDIYEQVTETKLGSGNLTGFTFRAEDRTSNFAAMMNVDLTELEQMAKAYDQGLMPLLLRPTGTFKPDKYTYWYNTVESATEDPWFFDVVRGIDIPMIVNVTAGIEFSKCPTYDSCPF